MTLPVTKQEPYVCKLSIKDLRLWVHLGCSPEERTNPQPISITLKLYFTKLPKGTITDVLTDTVCYFQITKLVEEIIAGRNFNLIEHLAHTIHEAVHKYLNSLEHGDATLKVIVNKLSPPVPNVLGGVSFSY